MTTDSTILPVNVAPPLMNRREFLTYAWGAALTLLTVETAAASYFFLNPRFRVGEFGGTFLLGNAEELPATDSAPQPNGVGKFWLVNTAEGPKAIYMVCTHLGCLYKWEAQENRFKCPCHASQFTREGYYIQGPAPRSLDQFVVEIIENDEIVAATSETTRGAKPPTITNRTAQLVVNTGQKITGQAKELSPAIKRE